MKVVYRGIGTVAFRVRFQSSTQMPGLKEAGVLVLLLTSFALAMTYVLWPQGATQVPGDDLQRRRLTQADGGQRLRHLLSDSTEVPEYGRTAVVVFQQDETDLIFDWIFYHSGIFGANRLYVIDHNSTAPSVTHLLSYAETVGVHVIRYDGPFIEKHQVLTDTMNHILDTCPGVDTVIPLDCDEFIVAADPSAANEDTYSSSPSVIRGRIDALPRDGFKYKFGVIQAAACNVDEMTLAEPRQRRAMTAMFFSRVTKTGLRQKTFFHRKGFLQTDQGNHIGKVENDAQCADVYLTQANPENEANDASSTLTFSEDGSECFHETPLALVHYGVFALSFTMWQRKMRRGALAYGFSETTECEGVGFHYCEAIKAMKEDEEGTRLRREAMHCTNQERFYSTFIVDALLGQSGALDYNASPKLEQSS